MAINQEEFSLDNIAANTISSIIAIPQAFNLDPFTLKRSPLNGTPKYGTLVASQIQNFFQQFREELTQSTNGNVGALNLLQEFRDLFGRVLYSKFYVSVIISFDDLKTLGFLMKEYMNSLEEFFKDEQHSSESTVQKFKQMDDQVKEIGSILFSEVKKYRQSLDLQNLFEMLQNESAEMKSTNQSIIFSKFIPGLSHQLTELALALGVNQNIIKRELESLSLTYLKYLNSGVLLQDQDSSYYKDFKQRLEPDRLEKAYLLNQKAIQHTLSKFKQIQQLWLTYFRKESCVTYRRMRKAIYLYFYCLKGQKIQKSALRLEQYLPPIGFFNLNSQDQFWKFQCVQNFMQELDSDLNEEIPSFGAEELKEPEIKNSPLLPDQEVQFQLRFMFKKEEKLSSIKLIRYSRSVTMNEHVYIGNSNPWFENDIELLTREDFLDPNCTQLIILKGEPKGFPQVIDLSGISVPLPLNDQSEMKAEEQVRLDSMNFFSYHKAVEPCYRIREGAIILVDTLNSRTYKVIENLPVELKSFYSWENTKEFKIVDPWMEFYEPKQKFSEDQSNFTLKDLLGQFKLMGEIAFDQDDSPIALNEEFKPDKRTKRVVEFQKVSSSVVIRARDELAKMGLNVGILMKKFQEMKDKAPSAALKITQPNTTIQVKKRGLSIKFIKI